MKSVSPEATAEHSRLQTKSSRTDLATRSSTVGVEIISFLFLLGVTALAYTLHWSFTIDDAAISFSYARNFAQGYGLGALYPGAPRVEGYSNLLWVILLAAGTKLGLDTVLVSKILGLFFSLGVIVLLYLILRPLIHHRWLLLGLALLPVSLTFTFWSVSGLENSLYAFLILLAVFFLLREDQSPDKIPLGSALSLVLVGMTRPEGLVYALAGLGYKVLQLAIRWRQKENRRILVKNLLSWLAIFLLGYGLFKAWHVAYFAAWWPNPIYAKAGWYKTDLTEIWFKPGGWTYLRGYFRTFAAVGILPALLFGGLVSMKGPQRVMPIFALAALALPLYTFDWMVNYRFLYPFLPFAVALLVLAADQLWNWLYNFWYTRRIQYPTSNSQLFSMIAAVVLVIWFGFSVARFAWVNLRLTQRQLACGYAPMAETRCLDGKMYWTMDEVDQKYSELQSFADQIGLDNPLYLIPDIGATSYLQNKRILDLAGLGDYQLARIREGALLKQYVFEEQRPDFIMTHGVWTRRTDLTTFNAFNKNYLPVEQGQDENGLVHGTFVRRDLLISPAPDPVATYECELAPGMFLVSTSSSGFEASAGQARRSGIDSFWLASQPQAEDWNLEIVIFDQTGLKIDTQTETLGYGWYPSSQWQSDEQLRQHIRLPEGLPAGEYQVSLRLIGNSGTPSNEDEERLEDQKHLCSIAVYLHEGTPGQEPASDQGQNPLNKVQSAWEAGNLESLLSSLQKNFASQRSQEWDVLGSELRQAASESAAQNDWPKAYQLYLAATLANPADAWAQRGLEQARRNYILTTN